MIERLRSYSRFSSNPTRKVWASRLNAPTRSANNAREKKIVDELKKRGFEIIDFGQLHPEETVALMGECAVFAGVHGANLTNAIFAPPGCRIREIVGAGKGTMPNHYLRISDACGHDYDLRLLSDDTEGFAAWIDGDQ